MHLAPIPFRLGLAGLIFAFVCAAKGGAQRAAAAPRSLIPADAPVAVEVDVMPLLLRDLSKARRAFTSGGLDDEEAETVRGDTVAWSVADALAGAVVQALRWPSDRRVRLWVKTRLEHAPGAVGVGWISRGRGLASVLVARGTDGPCPEPPAGLVAAVVHGHLVVAAEKQALQRMRGHLRGAAGPGRVATEGTPTCRVRLRPRQLRARLRSGSASSFAALRHFLVDWPERMTLDWRDGRETIRATAPDLTPRLVATAVPPAPPYIGCSLRWSGRLAVPEGLEGLARLLERDPLGIGSAVARAWPASLPPRDVLARHLGGRFQVLMMRDNGSAAPVPVVGLELVSAKRAVTLLDRLLVATGLCDRFVREPAPYTYLRRIPATLRRNRQLIGFFRFHGRKRRQYGVGVSGNWVWLGPIEEVQRVLGSLLGEDRPLVAPDPPANVRSPYAAGEIEIDPYALWQHLTYQQQFIQRDATRRDATESRLGETLGELSGVTRRARFTVLGGTGALVLGREVPLVDSLFTFLAARATRFHRVLARAESELRREVWDELTSVRGAQAIHHRLEGRYANSLDELKRVGLWRPRRTAEDRGFHLGVFATGDAFVAWALPRDAALADRPRPAYAVTATGSLMRGPADRAGLRALLEVDRGARWRPVEVE